MILDRLEEALDSVVGVRAGEFAGLLVVQDLESVIGLDVDLSVNVASILCNVFKGVTGVPVHVMVPVRSPAVGEEDHDLMDGLGVLRQIILVKSAAFVSEIPQDAKFLTYPEHISIF